MKGTQKLRKPRSRRKLVRFQTTLFDLVSGLSRRTEDDNLVVATVKEIVNSFRARFSRSLAPVKLVPTNRPFPHPRGNRTVRVSSVLANSRSTQLLYR
jgi:hypothetical protein